MKKLIHEDDVTDVAYVSDNVAVQLLQDYDNSTITEDSIIIKRKTVPPLGQ